MTALKVDGSAVTQPISAASLPLPAGAATSALQTTGNTSLTTINTTLGSPFQAGGALAANQSVNLNQVGGSSVVTGGTSGSQGVGGLAASGATQAGNPVKTGGVFNTTQPTVTTGQAVDAQMTNRGAEIVATGADTFNVTCSNCSGSGVSNTDEGAFTAGTSLFASGGGFFQTTATSNPLTTGQFGTFQVTANRALFSNLRNASGTEIGVAATPLQVSLANTAANSTAVKVDGSAVTQPISAAALPLPTGAATSALQTTGNTALTTINTTLGSPFQAAGALGAGSAIIGKISQVDSGGTDATDTTNHAVKVNLVAGGTVTQASTTSGQGGSLIMGAVTTSAPSYTTAQTDPVSLDTSGSLRVNCTTGCSSSGGSSVADESAFTFGTTPLTLGGGVFQTTATSNALTTGQGGSFQVTAQRALFTNLRNASGTEIGTSSTPVQVSLANTATNATAVKVDGSAVTQPVSGTVTANAGTNLNTSALALETGGNLATLAGGVTASVYQSNVKQVNGVTPLMGNGVTGTGSQRVTIACTPGGV
jgi:hypothetical protein